MPSISRSALVPFSRQQMFTLVNDIDRYPEFLPWCRAAKVYDRSSQGLTARVDIAKGPVRHSFATRNTAEENSRVDMQLVDGPFRRLQGRWQFDDDPSGLCRVSFSLEFDYASRLIGLTLGPIFEHAADRLVQAFCDRARTLYGDEHQR